MKWIRLLGALALAPTLLLVDGCHLERLAAAQPLVSAASYISALQEEGKLPGVAKNDRLSFTSAPVKWNAKSSETDTVTIRGAVEGKGDTLFWYLLKRPDSESPWSMAEAWQTDGKGNNRTTILPDRP